MQFIKKNLLWIIMVPLGIGVDQITKVIAAKYLVGKPIDVLGDWGGFYYTENTGMAWSFLSDKTWLLAIISFVACIVIAYFYFKGKFKSKWTKISLVMLFIGALGNGIDRLFRGYVIDFIKFNFFKLFGGEFPIFNVADIFVTIGAIILIVALLFIEGDKKENV